LEDPTVTSLWREVCRPTKLNSLSARVLSQKFVRKTLYLVKNRLRRCGPHKRFPIPVVVL